MSYQVNMKKNLMTLAVLLYCTMAMAQLNTAISVWTLVEYKMTQHL